ncbi:MAG: exosortase T [Acidiferrobacterales bacterium]
MYRKALSLLFSYQIFFAVGVVILAVHPVVWLVNTWTDPAYGSHGSLIFVLVASLFLWSVTSPRSHITQLSRQRALLLLGMTAAARLIGQLIGVNVIGALALVVDVFALGLLFGLSDRKRALSPGWLAVLFAFSLPLERIVQRTIGYGLQHISAAGACGVLRTWSDSVQCEGVRILLAGRDVLVDLPCSGARGLLLLLLLFSALAALTRPTLRQAFLGWGITLFAAVVANVLRIVTLAIGLAYSEHLGAIDVMTSPWHEIIGFSALIIGAAPVVLWALPIRARQCDSVIKWVPIASSLPRRSWHAPLAGFIFLFGAVLIVSLPARPVDVTRTIAAPMLPANIAGLAAVPGTLSAMERHYFTRYGGGAARASYGPYGLLVVSTSAPLRHLHAPDECLAGAGHKVRYLGMTHEPVAAAVYRSVAPDGRRWRVSVTFVSDRGEVATSVAEAVWRWLQKPAATWTMVQRIAPWRAPIEALTVWDGAVARAMDLPPPDTSIGSRTVVTRSRFHSVQS